MGVEHLMAPTRRVLAHDRDEISRQILLLLRGTSAQKVEGDRILLVGGIKEDDVIQPLFRNMR